MEITDLQEDISLQMIKTASTEEFWGKHVSERYENFKRLNLDTQRARKQLEFITNEHNMLYVAFLKNILK